MQNLIPQLITAFILVSVVEFILMISWSRWYFQTGIPAFHYTSKAAHPLSTVVTSSDIEALTQNSMWPLSAAKLNHDCFAIRVKLLALKNIVSMPLMHCVLAIDRGKGMVSIRGYLNWSIIAATATVLGMIVFAAHKVSLIISAIIMLSLVGFFVLIYFIQSLWLKTLCNQVARMHGRSATIDDEMSEPSNQVLGVMSGRDFMNAINELQKQVMQNPKKAAPEDLDTLARHYWGLAMDTDDFREKRKYLKKSGFFAGLAFAAGADGMEQLELYRSILQETSDSATLGRIIGRLLEKTGADKQEIISKAKGTVIVETGTISLGDRARFTPHGGNVYETTSEKAIMECVSRGERLTFGTGGDGQYRSEIRLIEAVEPVLTVPEYKKLSSSTQTVVIDVPSGALGMGDFTQFLFEPWDKQKTKGTVCLDVPPGRYKACVFGFATANSESVIAVVTATSDEARNETTSMANLFG